MGGIPLSGTECGKDAGCERTTATDGGVPPAEVRIKLQGVIWHSLAARRAEHTDVPGTNAGSSFCQGRIHSVSRKAVSHPSFALKLSF